MSEIVSQITKDLSDMEMVGNNSQTEAIVREVTEAVLDYVETAVTMEYIPSTVEAILDFMNDIVTGDR